jgi:hypothetical protein
MFCELFGPLIGLEDEWRAQGATPVWLGNFLQHFYTKKTGRDYLFLLF